MVWIRLSLEFHTTSIEDIWVQWVFKYVKTELIIGILSKVWRVLHAIQITLSKIVEHRLIFLITRLLFTYPKHIEHAIYIVEILFKILNVWCLFFKNRFCIDRNPVWCWRSVPRVPIINWPALKIFLYSSPRSVKCRNLQLIKPLLFVQLLINIGLEPIYFLFLDL